MESFFHLTKTTISFAATKLNPMKKLFLSFSVASILVFSMSSCEKVKDKVFPSFETSGGTVLIEVPVVTNTTTEQEIDATTMSLNIDSTIKANTDGKFSISNANSIKVRDITLTVLNGDEQNNISNFETAKLSISSNSNTTPAVIASANLADVNQPAVINGNDTEIKTYLQGSQITYKVSGKARRATTKELQLAVAVVLSVK